MYLGMATEEDKKMAKNWKDDADGILIFVRYLHFSKLYLTQLVIDWIILCCCCVVDIGVHSGHSTESAGYFQFLSLKHLQDCDRPQYFEFPPCFTTSFLSTELCNLGQCTLVPELGD